MAEASLSINEVTSVIPIDAGSSLVASNWQDIRTPEKKQVARKFGPPLDCQRPRLLSFGHGEDAGDPDHRPGPARDHVTGARRRGVGEGLRRPLHGFSAA